MNRARFGQLMRINHSCFIFDGLQATVAKGLRRQMAENSYRYRGSQPPMFKNVLVVDDNDRYAKALNEDLTSRGAEVSRALTAREALVMISEPKSDYDGIVTDISMESQLAGLKVITQARKLGFKGTMTVATTGLDTKFGYWVNRFFLGTILKVDFLIPKLPIKHDGLIFWIDSKDSGA